MDYLSYTRRASKYSDTMTRMMAKLGVDPATAVALDGGLGGHAACTRCIFCSKLDVCERWLNGDERTACPQDFCPNTAYFAQCLELQRRT